MVQQQAREAPAYCAFVLGPAAGSAVAAAIPAGWQTLEVDADPTADQTTSRQQQALHGAELVRHPVGSLHAVLWAVVSSHFPDGVIPPQVSSRQDAKPGTAQLVVAHAMKPSREAALAQRGMLPLLPADGVCFLPLRLDLPLDAQDPFHVLLHKVYA